MRKLESLSDLTLSEFLFLSKIDINDKKVEKYIVDYFKIGEYSIDDTVIFFNNLNNILKDIDNKKEYPLTLRFNYNGVEYGFIPNLRNIKTAEWLDFEINSDDPVRLMSILYRPIKKKFRFFNRDVYDIEEYKGSNDYLKDIPVDIYLGASFFLESLEMTLLEILNIYIVREQISLIKSKDLTLAQKQSLLSNITGII